MFFYSENEFVTAFRSLVTKVPYIYYTKALTNCMVVYIQINNLEELYGKSKGWEKFGRVIAEDAFIKILYRTESILFLKPEDRYLDLLQKYPTLPNKIPQYQIASFLGLENPS